MKLRNRVVPPTFLDPIDVQLRRNMDLCQFFGKGYFKCRHECFNCGKWFNTFHYQLGSYHSTENHIIINNKCDCPMEYKGIVQIEYYHYGDDLNKYNLICDITKPNNNLQLASYLYFGNN